MLEVLDSWERASARTNEPMLVQSVDGSLRGLAQECFQRMEDQLNWIEVRRIRRQVAQRCADGLDCLLYTSGFVERHIIDHDQTSAVVDRGVTGWQATIIGLSKKAY